MLLRLLAKNRYGCGAAFGKESRFQFLMRGYILWIKAARDSSDEKSLRICLTIVSLKLTIALNGKTSNMHFRAD